MLGSMNDIWYSFRSREPFRIGVMVTNLIYHANFKIIIIKIYIGSFYYIHHTHTRMLRDLDPHL